MALLGLLSGCRQTPGQEDDRGKNGDFLHTETRVGQHDLGASNVDLPDLTSAIADNSAPLIDAKGTEIIDLVGGADGLVPEHYPQPDGVLGDALPEYDLTSAAETAGSPDLTDAEAWDLAGKDSVVEATGWTCPYDEGVCIGLTYFFCDAQTEETHVLACPPAFDPCMAATCIDEIGCQLLPTSGNACSDNDPCTSGDYCQSGDCAPGTAVVCNDDNPCTSDLCESTSGECLYAPVDGGPCAPNSECVDGECLPSYPPPPHGPFQGDIMANHSFVAPEELGNHSMVEFYGDGEVLLMTFNAGWCKVCKEDTVVLNDLLATHSDAGLRVLSILYETPQGTPINQGYAQWWAEYYKLTFPLWMDNPTANAAGKAEGGVLATYRQPSGPVANGFFPVTLVICTATMEILYVDKGFYDEVVLEIVDHWLYKEDCSGGPAGP